MIQREELIVGALHRREFRTFLRQVKFDREDFDWLEEKRLLASVFTLRGGPETMAAVRRCIRRCLESNGYVAND